MNLALIIISYNSYKDIQELLVSIEAQKRQPDIIIVVDNCSPNGDGNRLRELSEIKNFEYILAPENRGFAAGCNLGVAHAKSLGITHIGFINPDTIFSDSNFLVQLEEAFSTTQYGIIGTYVIQQKSKMIEFGGSDIMPGFFYPKVRNIGKLYTLQNSILQIEETDYTTGSSLFFPLSLFDQIGPLDESYFLYFEETDWCLRARRFDYRVGIISSTYLEHKTSTSVGFRSSLYTKYMIRNYARFALRFAQWYELPLWFLLYIGFWVPGQLVSHLYRKLL